MQNIYHDIAILEELDSYLYQTVGQDAIELVARALEVPLYRRVITGQAIEQGSEYGGRLAKGADAVAGDETEDLFELLSTVKVGVLWPVLFDLLTKSSSKVASSRYSGCIGWCYSLKLSTSEG